MSIAPLDQGDMYFDPIASFVLQAEGTVDANDCHNFTMLYPTYSQFNVHDSSVKKLISCNYDPWTNVVEYYDNVIGLVKVDLKAKTQTSSNSNSNNQQTNAGVSQQKSQSQQNWGWTDTQETKKPEKTNTSVPFKIGCMLFHKTTRTKWIFTEIDSLTQNPVLRSFYDKNKAMQIFKKDYEEFEEIFF